MAAPMRACSLSLCRRGHTILVASSNNQYFSNSKTYSTSNPQESHSPRVGVSPDGRTVLLWHPKQKFPYEHSKPLPRNEAELKEGNSKLRVQHLTSDHYRYSASGPDISELSGMFFTTKHRWYPKSEKKYRKRNPPKDRDGL